MRFHPDLPEMSTLRAAVLRVRRDTPRRWGTLDAGGMVEHCARFNELYLGRRSAPWYVRLAARLLGGVFIRRYLASSPFEMERGMTTLPALRVGSAGTPDFESARTRLLETLAEVEAVQGRWAHPLYGDIDAGVGRALVRHHTAHHLHQFGVLGPGTAPSP